MTAPAHHLLLVVALAALGAAGLRVAAGLGAEGALRVVAAVPLAAAMAALSALALGRLGLAGSGVLLALAALAAYAAARMLVPAPPPLRVRGAWCSLTGHERLVLGAVGGAAAAWVAWVLRHPALGTDPLTYHLPMSIAWVQHGDTGAVRQLAYEFPVGNYPLLDETLVAWLLAVGRSFAATLLWAPAMAALAAFAGFTGLRRLGAGRAPAALGVAAVLSVPILAALYVGPHTDVAALAWLTCAATLVQAARRRPGMLVPALIAAGLAVGTKTTTAPLLLALALVAVRAPLSSRARLSWRARLSSRAPLAAAAAVALVVGGSWYLRNLAQHGSPLWPFIAAPWGDPVPPLLEALDVAFLDRPYATVHGRAGDYARVLGGALVLLPAALAAGALLRRRAVVTGAAVTALAVLAWSRAPFTGRAGDPRLDLSITTVRYLLPVCAAAAVVLGLAWARSGPRGRRAVTAVLGLAAAVSLWRALALGHPDVPSAGTLALGAAAGWAASALLARTGLPGPRPALAAAVVVAVGGLTAAGHGFAARHATNPRLASSPMIGWLAAQPGFREGDAPVASAPQVFAPLAGDRLQHDLELIPAGAPCGRVLAHPGWVVVGPRALTPFSAGRCLADRRPVYRDARFRVYDLRHTASTSSTSSRPSSVRRKSSSVIAAEPGSPPARTRLSSRS